MSQEMLFEELSPSQAGLIRESSTDGKHTWLNGIFMQGGIKNRNGRVYPINEIQAAVTSAQQRIKEANGIFGELDHPTTLTIGADRISHVITELKMEGQNAIGKAKILNTPMGNIAQALVESGVAMGVSSRGAGQVGSDGNVSGYIMHTVDIVVTPSAPGAYPTSVVESLESIKTGEVIMSLAESMQHDDTAQKYFKKEIMKWLSSGVFAKK